MSRKHVSCPPTLVSCLRRVACLGGLAGCLLTSYGASAQTALIAHRSHGGTARSFMAGAAEDNFGRVPVEEAGEKLTVTKVVRRADGTVLRYGHSDVQGAVVDSFTQGFPFTDPAYTTKDARRYFGPGVEVVGFGRKSKPATSPKAKPPRPHPASPAADSGQTKPAEPAAPPRRRRSQLLPAALPPNRTGPTLLVVLATVAAAGLLWRGRGAVAQPRTA